MAALATLHKGAPAVSMVPFALLPRGAGFVIHVSRLATHTADLLANPAVALLVVAPVGSTPTPRQLPRASVQGLAQPIAADTPQHAVAKARYLERFPDSAEIFGFGDFSLVNVAAQSVRFVGGFANTATILASAFEALMSGPMPPAVDS